ncbi:MAG TPA: hypothetical protein VFF13_05695 [archaeon]|nr:hypothetical protein [archaeon]
MRLSRKEIKGIVHKNQFHASVENLGAERRKEELKQAREKYRPILLNNANARERENKTGDDERIAKETENFLHGKSSTDFIVKSNLLIAKCEDVLKFGQRSSNITNLFEFEGDPFKYQLVTKKGIYKNCVIAIGERNNIRYMYKKTKEGWIDITKSYWENHP